MSLSTTRAIRIGTAYKEISQFETVKIVELLTSINLTHQASEAFLSMVQHEEKQQDAALFKDYFKVQETPNEWIVSFVESLIEYPLIRSSQWLKRLRNTGKKPTGLHLGLLWIADHMVSLFIHVGLLAAYILSLAVLATVGIIGGIFMLFPVGYQTIECLSMMRKYPADDLDHNHLKSNLKKSWVVILTLMLAWVIPLVMIGLHLKKMVSAHPFIIGSLIAIPLVALFLPSAALPLIATLSKGVSIFTAGLFTSNVFGIIGSLAGISTVAILSVKLLGNTLRSWYDHQKPKGKEKIVQHLLEDKENELLLKMDETLEMCKSSAKGPQNYPERSPKPPEAVNAEAIKASLMKKYNDEEVAHKYMTQIHNNTTQHDAKISRKSESKLPSSVLKINGQHYLFDKKLGSGFCGTAKKTIHLETGAPVVVKITKPKTPMSANTFFTIAENERVMLSAANKNVCSWLRKSEMNKFYLTQPYVEGKPADLHIKDNPPTVEEAKKFILCLVNALKKLHDQKIFHGDIKLENLIFNETTTEAEFIDLGLAINMSDSEIHESGNLYRMMPHPSQGLMYRPIVGLSHQRSPEWIEGEGMGLDTDIFALGETLRDLLQKIKLTGPEGDDFKQAMMTKIIEPMTAPNRNDRPTIDSVISAMKHLGSHNIKPKIERL